MKSTAVFALRQKHARGAEGWGQATGLLLLLLPELREPEGPDQITEPQTLNF